MKYGVVEFVATGSTLTRDNLVFRFRLRYVKGITSDPDSHPTKVVLPFVGHDSWDGPS